MRIYVISGEKGSGKTTLAKRLATDKNLYIETCTVNAEMLLLTVSETIANTITLDLINPHDKGMLRLIFDLMMDQGFLSQSVKLMIVIFEDIPEDFKNLPYVNYIQLVRDRYRTTSEELLIDRHE